MRVPMDISQTLNVYLAFRAALIAVLAHNAIADVPIRSLLVPGLGTGIGEVAPDRAAVQMRLAYNAIINGEGIKSRNARAVLRRSTVRCSGHLRRLEHRVTHR